MRVDARLTALSLAVGMAAVGVTAAWSQSSEDIIVQRENGYKHIGQLFGAMKKGIDANADVTQFSGPAQEIVAWGQKIPTLFPEGTQRGHETHAKPEIWTNRPEFNKLSADLVTEARKLAQVAQSGDKAAFAAQWKQTGATCGACHQKFRFRYT